MKHESALGHVTGRAIYTDEELMPAGSLSVYPVQAPFAHAEILAINFDGALKLPGVLRVLTASDIPGENDTGPILHDEPLIPATQVQYFGQAVAWVVAETEAQAQAAAACVQVEYRELAPLLSIRAAIDAGSYHLPPVQVMRGDVAAALAQAPHTLKGTVDIGGQDHFYLETHASAALVDSEGIVRVSSSTQHPTETQIIVARVLGIVSARVVVRCLRMGGGFGGKETQANTFAAIVALAAQLTGRPVRIKLNRALDMQLTGKRHPFFARYQLGFSHAGELLAVDLELVSDGGWSCDLSPPVLMRAMVHVDNAYFIPAIRVRGLIAKTHLASNTAFRGFGGPQGMLIGEEILDRVARHLGHAPHTVRELNFYQDSERNLTHYGQPVVDNVIAELWQELKTSSDFNARLFEIAEFNKSSKQRKRGLAITPVKFGISFNKTEYNQAGALVHVYTDGSVQLNHGGTEMGQGLHSKMLSVAARTLGISVERIQLMVTATDKVPNTSATAASSGADLNGQAVKVACEELQNRLRGPAAELLGGAPEAVQFHDDHAYLRDDPARRIPFVQVVKAAYSARISLSATGYYRTPGLHWDASRGQGHPFYYFAFGAAVSEVSVCGYSGAFELTRVDLLHDVGRTLNEAIDRGQIEGGFVQGLGWLTCEELRYDAAGKLLTDAPSTYKIPTVCEVPHDFRVALFTQRCAPSTETIFHSKGVGEPPLMLALSVREALRAAISAFGETRSVPLPSPLTPEAIFNAIQEARRQ